MRARWKYIHWLRLLPEFRVYRSGSYAMLCLRISQLNLLQKKSVFYDTVTDWSTEWSKWDPYATKVRETSPKP